MEEPVTCKYCKTVVNQGATKCPECSEWIKLLKPRPALWLLIEIVIPVVLGILACFEYARANREQRAAIAATEDKEQAIAILEEMPRKDVLESAQTRVDSGIFGDLQKRNFMEVEKQLQARLKENPKDEQARKGLIYSRVLRRAQ